jgi:hypothetical protein
MSQGALAFLGNHSSFCALWLFIVRSNEVAIPRKTVVFLLAFCYKAVTIVLKRCGPLFGQDTLSKNPIKEYYRKLTEDVCAGRVNRGSLEAVTRICSTLREALQAAHGSPFAEPISSYRCHPKLRCGSWRNVGIGSNTDYSYLKLWVAKPQFLEEHLPGPTRWSERTGLISWPLMSPELTALDLHWG